MKAPPAEPNRRWGRTIVAALRRAGVSRFFFSPGARSSPLVDALSSMEPESVTAHYDERGMAFTALGWAKATGSPAAALTTSGSAVANLHPAVIEAGYSEVPLLVLTADRPPELHGIGANQTIQQKNIFGDTVRAELNLSCASEAGDSETETARIAAAVAATVGPSPGPVHINAAFREPLLETETKNAEPAPGSSPGPALPETDAARPMPSGAWFSGTTRGVIVLGALPAVDQRAAHLACRLGEHLGWPVFADALAGPAPGSIRHADLILHQSGVPSPERVIHFGNALVSKRLAGWLAACGGDDCLHVRRSPRPFDPGRQDPRRIQTSLAAFCNPLLKSVCPRQNSGWLEGWRTMESAAASLITKIIDRGERLTGPAVVRAVAASWRGHFFLGNSMPVRQWDSFTGETRGAGLVFGNRGASGIDGNIGTIAGIAMGLGEPVAAILGDLACLHDLNSLALLRNLPVTLIVLNNNGGGIFQFVPQGIDAARRETFWETPHGMNFSHAAAQFGIRYVQAGTAAALRNELAGGRGPCLVECITDRAGDFVLHGEMEAAMRAVPLPWDPVAFPYAL